jgi:sugar/nucleoside kinase (ribokinase family)
VTQSGPPDAVVAGHICLDIIPNLAQMNLATPGEFFTPGKLVNTDAAILSTGGPVSNTGLALVKLGINTALMGKVGRDPFGHLIRLLLEQRWGIFEGPVAAEDAVTSYTVVLSPPGHDRMFLHCPGANDTFASEDIDYDLVARARLFHFGYPPLMRRMFERDGEELIEIFRRVKALGVTTSLDMALPDPDSPSGRADWRKILAGVLPYVDVFLPSAEETLFMLDRKRFGEHRSAGGDMLDRFTGDDLHALSETLLQMGAAVAVIKVGHRGIYLRSATGKRLGGLSPARAEDPTPWAERELWHPAFDITPPPNATGSGDSAIAGFLAALLRGHLPGECLRFANGNGAFNVMTPDALSGIRPWEELTETLRDGWDTQKLELTGSGWRRGAGALWRGPADSGEI